jgi:hypothetical protein
MTQARPMMRKKMMMNLLKIQMTKLWLVRLCCGRQWRYRTDNWKDLPQWSYPSSRWIVEYQDYQARLPRLLSHQFKNKTNLINIPKLYLQSPKILKQSDSLSYEP